MLHDFKYVGSKHLNYFQCPQCEKCLRNTSKEQLFKAENAAQVIATLEPWTKVWGCFPVWSDRRLLARHPRPPGEAAAAGRQAEVSLLQHAGQLASLFSRLRLTGDTQLTLSLYPPPPPLGSLFQTLFIPLKSTLNPVRLSLLLACRPANATQLMCAR